MRYVHTVRVCLVSVGTGHCVKTQIPRFCSHGYGANSNNGLNVSVTFTAQTSHQDNIIIITARCTMHSAKRGLAIACRLSVCLSVCPSVTLVICDHIGWKSWKLTARTISTTPSLLVAERRSTYSQGNMGKFGGD